MTIRFYISIFSTGFFLANVLFACSQFSNVKLNQTKNIPINNFDTSHFDSSQIAVILFNTNSYNPFDGSYRKTNLTNKDIEDIEKLLLECVNEHNELLDGTNKEWAIDLKKVNYKMQLMPALRQNGEKEVWVNCFCGTVDGELWRKELILFYDNGSCYFNFKINLTKKTWKYFSVNGFRR